MTKADTEKKPRAPRSPSLASDSGASREVRLEAQLLRRVVVEGVHPEIDGGRFPIKRTAGEDVLVGADIFTDAHDKLAAALRHRRVGDAEWRETPMAEAGNDRWH